MSPVTSIFGYHPSPKWKPGFKIIDNHDILWQCLECHEQPVDIAVVCKPGHCAALLCSERCLLRHKPKHEAICGFDDRSKDTEKGPNMFKALRFNPSSDRPEPKYVRATIDKNGVIIFQIRHKAVAKLQGLNSATIYEGKKMADEKAKWGDLRAIHMARVLKRLAGARRISKETRKISIAVNSAKQLAAALLHHGTEGIEKWGEKPDDHAEEEKLLGYLKDTIAVIPRDITDAAGQMWWEQNNPEWVDNPAGTTRLEIPTIPIGSGRMFDPHAEKPWTWTTSVAALKPEEVDNRRWFRFRYGDVVVHIYDKPQSGNQAAVEEIPASTLANTPEALPDGTPKDAPAEDAPEGISVNDLKDDKGFEGQQQEDSAIQDAGSSPIENNNVSDTRSSTIEGDNKEKGSKDDIIPEYLEIAAIPVESIDFATTKKKNKKRKSKKKKSTKVKNGPDDASPADAEEARSGGDLAAAGELTAQGQGAEDFEESDDPVPTPATPDEPTPDEPTPDEPTPDEPTSDEEAAANFFEALADIREVSGSDEQQPASAAGDAADGGELPLDHPDGTTYHKPVEEPGPDDEIDYDQYAGKLTFHVILPRMKRRILVVYLLPQPCLDTDPPLTTSDMGEQNICFSNFLGEPGETMPVHGPVFFMAMRCNDDGVPVAPDHLTIFDINRAAERMTSMILNSCHTGLLAESVKKLRELMEGILL